MLTHTRREKNLDRTGLTRGKIHAQNVSGRRCMIYLAAIVICRIVSNNNKHYQMLVEIDDDNQSPYTFVVCHYPFYALPNVLHRFFYCDV
jgi:hypothetical protein